jgi:hypothetical protein
LESSNTDDGVRTVFCGSTEAFSTRRHNDSTRGFPDRRPERNARGLIKFKIERGVPDVGGIGWRTKHGHLLKNQTFYHQPQNENLWDNPTHAGPKTWREWHGPKSRSDAALMERLDREDQRRAEWEAKRTFGNASRVETLDRLAKRCEVNDEKAVATSWAPPRRARREVHDSLDRLGAELDAMSLKELKKVLTPHVLKTDREAVRRISGHLQQEESWKEAWRSFELERRDDLLTDLEHRQAYNAMVQEMSGQLPRPRRDPSRHLPNDCTSRVEQLALPKQARRRRDVTQLSDCRGLIHVDHDGALEARHRGAGETCEAARKTALPAADPCEGPNTVLEEVSSRRRYSDARQATAVASTAMQRRPRARREPAPTLASVTGDIDAFESSMQPVPRLGNFWMPEAVEQPCRSVASVSDASGHGASVVESASQVPVTWLCPADETTREASST